jgi:ribosomal-protein-alanine N-acetyltransferase
MRIMSLRLSLCRSAPQALPLPTPGATVRIERMRRRHVRSVLAIEQQVFPRPWSAALYLSEISQPATRAYIVALVDGAVVGYAGCMIVAGEGHVTTVGVDPTWQGRRVGMRVVYEIVREARRRGATALTLEVRVSNHRAQQLYRLFGFAPAGIRKNYYAEVNEDAIVMWAHDVDTPAYDERLAGIAERLGLTR